MATGIMTARALLQELAEQEVPAACEWVDPVVGRLPVGPGDVGGDRREDRREPAPPAACLRADDARGHEERDRRRHPGGSRRLPGRGRVPHVPRQPRRTAGPAAITTAGNKDTCIVLRGGSPGPNYQPAAGRRRAGHHRPRGGPRPPRRRRQPRQLAARTRIARPSSRRASPARSLGGTPRSPGSCWRATWWQDAKAPATPPPSPTGSPSLTPASTPRPPRRSCAASPPRCAPAAPPGSRPRDARRRSSPSCWPPPATSPIEAGATAMFEAICGGR